MTRFETLCPEYLTRSPAEAAEFYMQDIGNVSTEQLEYLEGLNGDLAESLRGEQDYDEPPPEPEQREHVADCMEAIHAELVKALEQRSKEPDPKDAPESDSEEVENDVKTEEETTDSPSVRVDVLASANEYDAVEVSEVSSCQSKKKRRRRRSPVATEDEAPPPRKKKKKKKKKKKEPEPEPEPVRLPCRELCKSRFDDGWKCDSIITLTTTGYDTNKTEIGYNAAQWLNALEGATVGSVVGWASLAKTAPAAVGVAGKVFGGLAIAGGAIELVISLRRLGKTSVGIGKLRKIVRDHAEADEDGIEARIAKYALKKKWRKLRRTGLAVGFAVVAIASGIVGLAVAGPVGWGIALGLAIFGIIGAAGFLGYRYYRYRKKEKERKARVETYADHLLDCADRGGDTAATSMMPNISNWGRQERQRNRETLVDKLLQLDVSERFLMASSLVGLFLEDWTVIRNEEKQAKKRGDDDYVPDERPSYTLLSAISVKPHKAAAAFNKALDKAEKSDDDEPVKECYRKLVETVRGKLKSW